MKHSPQSISGVTLIDVIVATSIAAFGIAGMYGLLFYSISSLRTTDDSLIASKTLSQRIAQIQRIPGWVDLTTPSNISTLFSSPVPNATQNLSRITLESVTFSSVAVPYASPEPSPKPSPTATPAPFTVTRTTRSSGVSVSTSSSTALSSASAVNVKVRVQWSDQSGRSHSRELSTILSNAGVTR